MTNKVFLDYDQAELDRQYNQRAWVTNADEHIRRYATMSEAVRARLGAPETIAYGAAATETLDFYRAARAPAPLAMFLHGGAWQRLSKRESGFAAEAFVYRNAERHGIARDRIHLVGHSSGGHLAACAMTTDWAALDVPQPIKGGLCVSGIYDLRPVRLSARNEYLRLDDAGEEALSPRRHVDCVACPLIVAAAEFDAPEFRRQARDFAAAVACAGATVRHVEVDGFNHFDIIDTLADPQGILGTLIFEQMELSIP